MASECYRIGGIVLNAGTQEVTRAGVAISLPPLSFQLLLLLARKAPNVVTTRDLEEQVWNGVVVDRGTINKRVVLVRNALREAGCVQDYVAVVRGTGYRLTVPVEPVDCGALDTTAGSQERVLPANEPPAGGTDRWRGWIWGAVALLALATFGLVHWLDHFGEGDAQSPTSSSTRMTMDASAYSLFLEGRALMNDRMNAGLPGLLAARQKFESAIERDPAFLQAHVGAASINFLLGNYDPDGDPETYMAQAEASARYALELDPAAADALGVLAAILASRGESIQAASLFDRAYLLGGRDTNVLHWHAMLYNSMGYFESLVPMLESAWEKDPFSPLMACSLAGAFNLGGQPSEAVQVLIGMPRFDRRDLLLGLAHIYLQDYDAAREMLADLPLRTGRLPADYADHLVSAFEDPLRREAIEQKFVDAARSGELDPLLVFEVLMMMGSPRAFDLEVDVSGTAFAHRMPEEIWSNWGVELRRDPRFKAWIRNLGYDQYWREFGWPDRCKPTGRDDFECV